MLPTFKLHDRLRAVTDLYPPAVESFLDVGCCRGYFVLDAARRPSCRLAVGIDVYEPFVLIANEVRQCLGANRAAFHLADLKSVAEQPRRFGGPFQVVLLLNAYHYLYWGSGLCADACPDHREILLRLSRVCAERVIFVARLEVDRLPDPLRKEAAASDRASDYTTARFLAAADEWFNVDVAGHVARDALLVMTKRKRNTDN